LHALARFVRVIVRFGCVLIALGIIWLWALLLVSGFRLITLSVLLSTWLRLLFGLPKGAKRWEQYAEKYKNAEPSSEQHRWLLDRFTGRVFTARYISRLSKWVKRF
jgi:biopolymer transport protein ExbB/TolQ